MQTIITDQQSNKNVTEKAHSNISHCVKSVRIRSYSGPYFPAFGLNTETFSPNAGKYGPE